MMWIGPFTWRDYWAMLRDTLLGRRSRPENAPRRPDLTRGVPRDRCPACGRPWGSQGPRRNPPN